MIGDKHKIWINKISKFLLGQGLLQLINLITGFFILRWLSIQDYAQFGTALAFQSSLSMLVDMGFSGSIIAMVGPNIHDKNLVGSYINTAKVFRNKLLIILGIPSAFLFLYLGNNLGWSYLQIGILFCSIISAVFFQGFTSYYSSPLLMQKEITKQYLPQISASALKLIIHYIFYIINSLSASIALLIHTCTVIYVGSQYKKLSSAFANYEAKTDPAKHKELVNYVTPSIPSLIYIALSGHITIFLISFFGNNQSIAEVSALGRINQIFIVITSFISVFVGPYFAQLHIRELFKNYLITVANAVLLATFIFFIFYFVPQPLLWILGEKYADMESELTLSVLASCLNIVYNTMWAIHNSRKWIFWYGTFLFIGISVVSQVVGIIFLDLSTSYGVLLFNIYLTVAIGFVHLWTAVYGFYRNSTQENSKIMTTV